MTPIPYNLILMIANKVLNRTPFIPPEVLLQIFRQVSSCANPANSLRSITLASRYHALVAREVLWRTVTFIGEQRTRHRKWFSAEMRKYTFIRLIASCNSSPLPPFLPLIRRLELVASSDHQDWMYDAKMVQIVKAISGHDGLRHLRIQSATFRQIVFTRFIDTIFPSLNSTLLELSLDNVVLFDPSVFNTLLSLQFIRFEGVFFKGIKVDAQLVDVIEDNGMENTSGPSSPAKWLAWRVSDTDLIPPQDIIHPRIRSFTYARCSLAVDSYLGPAQERILSYLDLSELSTANFRLRYEDDYLTLATVLQQASTTLRVLILDLTLTIRGLRL
ncbi:hypothetical protein CC1G_04814 [Coprinopsis cinerea okayama7|uniref:Uncharacterized protein n=1 Tax=Coprinopsis cinerea (strain Okayama-7 / 130 / ATCC MYA-4618 / FGSC 9003) TaxID=240176 RepID=A8P2N5_COPC7|nr:hypothetical protein CC1G_04814 [Coprinopsis cinerea okayama7\|eukprot:XP_001838370.2 hypothetical protein CC1G_04814 [Coprinopsis cinerea okayama7\